MEGINGMTPFKRMANGLHHIRSDLNDQLDELLAFAEVMARKNNTLDLDENGFFYVTCSGTLEDIIPTMQRYLRRLERIKEEKESN